MKFDRNTIIGIVILGALFIGYFAWTSKEAAEARRLADIEQAKKDSINKANGSKIDSVAFKKDSNRTDSMGKTGSSPVNQLQKSTNEPEKTFARNNGLLNITFTSKGGQLKKVELLNFKGIDSMPVKLASSDYDKIDYQINVAGGGHYISEFNFKDSVINNADGSINVVYTFTADSSSENIQHIFTIRPNDYMIDFAVKMNGADKLLSQGKMNLVWQYRAVQQESDISFEKQNTQIGYVMDDEFDYHTAVRRTSKDFDKPVKWLGVRQRFFNAFLLAKNNFSNGKINWEVPQDSSKTVLQSKADMQIQMPVQKNAEVAFGILYGPADIHVLKKYDQRFEKLINLGQGAYAFVRPLNRFIVIPVFDFVKSFSGSIGLAIALLTIIIRLITSPLMYPGYKTSAQMKLLRPDLAKLKEKYPDQQQYAMEQMKYMREGGVNQFAGCLPALVQIPIFFSLYSFFNASIALRGQSFLWAKDLSAPDAVINFGVHIPLLGSHLSLFTLTAVLTSFLISLYGLSMSPDQSNPVMKYMPYFFPFFLLFIFNRLPAALTWYYTVSNLITLALQYVIQNYIIDHDKLLAKIEANRKKPKTKSKWQERMEQIQEQQKRMKETQQKNRR
jgi:YidC/Oxa1 family membrane protein insertase